MRSIDAPVCLSTLELSPGEPPVARRCPGIGCHCGCCADPLCGQCLAPRCFQSAGSAAGNARRHDFPAPRQRPLLALRPGQHHLPGRLAFHSPYEGTNSFRNAAEYKTSLLGTLYTALRPTRSIRYNTDLILDLESSGGRGLSQALGLAGFTNLDVVRNPTLGPVPYLARYQIHQVFGLTQETVSQEPGFFGVAPSVPFAASSSASAN